MSLFRRILGRFPLGIWAGIVAIVLLIAAWSMQAYSLLDWDAAVDWGLQNERFTGDAAERTWARESWGVAVTDMLWPMPLSFVALAGLLRKKAYGFIAALLVMAIGVYFPLVFAFQRWPGIRGTILAALVLFTVPSLVGIMGLYANREYFFSNLK